MRKPIDPRTPATSYTAPISSDTLPSGRRGVLAALRFGAGLVLLFGGRRGMQFIGTSLGVLLLLGSVTALIN